ncbi:stage V sporulation protein SpoVM [Sporosarcina sp. FA9]|uniref:stage V sporulation protein SpoVM n=1 Tax=Sporosarcina sp. FA9 TaxID=3413030 RepID=UPI003F65D41F
MLERSEELRVYTFTLPKFVSGFVRKCIYVFQKEDTTKANIKPKKRKKEKTPS